MTPETTTDTYLNIMYPTGDYIIKDTNYLGITLSLPPEYLLKPTSMELRKLYIKMCSPHHEAVPAIPSAFYWQTRGLGDGSLSTHN